MEGGFEEGVEVTSCGGTVDSTAGIDLGISWVVSSSLKVEADVDAGSSMVIKVDVVVHTSWLFFDIVVANWIQGFEVRGRRMTILECK